MTALNHQPINTHRNPATDLAFSKGDIVRILRGNDANDPHWVHVENVATSQQGKVPKNHFSTPYFEPELSPTQDQPLIENAAQKPAKKQNFCRAVCLRRCCCKGCCSLLCTSLALLFVVIAVVATVLIGAAVEGSDIDAASSTDWFYQTASVCGENGVTFANSSEAASNGTAIFNCGACGKCSTKQDIAIYRNTVSSLTDTATTCAFRSFLGESYVRECLEDKVGFTTGCSQCWIQNIMCDLQNCKFTCIMSMIQGGSNNEDDGGLNRCLECDEKLCGPAFTSCSGANRRRVGIQSDIVRDNRQICPHVGSN